MNWKNSICLNLTLAKGVSTLPSFITLQSSRAFCCASTAILKEARTSCISFSSSKMKENRLFSFKSHSFQNPLNSEMAPSFLLKGYNKFKEKRTCLTLRAALSFPKEVCVRGNVMMLASKKDVILYKMEKEVIDAGKPMFFNQCFDKGRLKNFVLWFLLNYGESKTVQLVEQLKNVGFQYASKAGISLGIDDLKIPPKKNDLIYEAEKLTQIAVNKYASGEITGVERFQSLIDIWHRTSEFLKQEVINYFEATDILNPVYMMAFSGARGNISQVRQLVGMRGLMADPQGQIIDFPIRSNFREGLTLTEYIISSYGARKGIVDTALRTANAGYLTRRLVDVAQHVIISNFDCGTRRGIFLTNMKEGNKTIHSVSQRIVGRILARDLFKDSDSPNPIQIASRNDEVTLDLAFEIGKYFSKVFVRSPLTCETAKQICQLCYGWSLAQGNLVSIGEAVGVVAAQSIGEPGTQLTMRTFHTGGVFSGDVSDQIKAPFDGIVEYEAAIPGTLIRTPEGRIAFLTKVEGYFYVHKPSNNTEGVGIFTKNSDKKLKESLFSESKKFKIPSLTLLYIKNGQQVYAKDVIAQISTISRKANAAAGLAEEAELTIKSECEGQFYSKSLVLNEKEIGPSLPSTLTEEEEAKTTISKKPAPKAKASPASKAKAQVVKKNDVFYQKATLATHLWCEKAIEQNPTDFEALAEGEGVREEQEDSESIAIDKIYQSWTWGYAWILSGKIYEYKLPSLFFPKLGDFMNSKSYISQIEWKLNPSNGHNVFYNIHKRTPGNILNQKHYMSPLPSALLAPVQEAHQDKIGDSFFTVKNSKKGIGLKSNESFNETLMCKAQSNSTKKGVQAPIAPIAPSVRVRVRAAQCENVSPMQSSQILFFDLTKILYKKYGYAFQLPEKTQFFKKSKIASLNNPSFNDSPKGKGSSVIPPSSRTRTRTEGAIGAIGAYAAKESKENAVAAIVKSKSNKQTQKDLLFFIKSLTMLNTSNTRTELPYFLQWFPSKNQTLTGGYVLLETNPTMDSMISQKSHFLHKFNTSLFSPSSPSRTRTRTRTEGAIGAIGAYAPKAKAQATHQRCEKAEVQNTLKAKNCNALPKEGNENISFKLLSTLIKQNRKKIKMHFASSLFTSPTAHTLSRVKKRKPALSKAKAPVTSYSLEGRGLNSALSAFGKGSVQALEMKKTEALESSILWVSSSFFKIKLSSLTNCKTSLLFNTSKDSPLLYLTQPFEKSHFFNEQNGLLTPTLKAATPLTSEQEIPTQKDEEVQETKNTNLELSQKQSAIKKLNFLFFNKKMPMFLQTNRQGNIKGFQKYNFDSLSWGSANKQIQNPLETEGALLKLKVSNFLTSYSTLPTPSSSHICASSRFVQSSPAPKAQPAPSAKATGELKSQGQYPALPTVQALENNKMICTKGTKRINDKKRKLSYFKQFEFANLTTYCRFVNTSFSSLTSATSLKFKDVLSKYETSKLEVKPQKHIKLPSVCASDSLKAKTRIYFGTFSTFTTLIDNSFNEYATRLLRNSAGDSSKQLLRSASKAMKQEKEIERKRSLFFVEYLRYSRNFFVSNYCEKEYKRFNQIQNKDNFYSFMNQHLFQLTPCLQIHYVRDRSIKENLLNTLSTSIEKGFQKPIETRSISKKTELRRGKFVKKKAKISHSFVFSPSAYGALKKGWVVIPASSKLELWKLHKKRINPGEVIMDKMIFNTPLLTECFLFNDIFNIETISLPKSFSFGNSALVTNTKAQHLALAPSPATHTFDADTAKKASPAPAPSAKAKAQAEQSAEDVNGLYWVKNNKSRYFIPSPSSHTAPSPKAKAKPALALSTLPKAGEESVKVLENGGGFESVKAQIESNSLIKNNVKIGLFIQPVEEYKKMSNFEFKNYVYESNSNTLKNLCKNIESFDKSNIALTKTESFCNGCFASRIYGKKVARDSNMSKKRSMLKAIQKKSIYWLSSKLRAVPSRTRAIGAILSHLRCEQRCEKAKAKSAIQSRVNQSFDSLLNWQKYKYNLYNKQNRTLQPLAKFTQKDFSVFSVALWTERTKVLFEKYLSSLRNFNKASASSGTSSPKAKKSQKLKKVTNTTKKTGMRSGLKSNLLKEEFNLKKLSQKPLYVVSRKPLNLSPFLISFDNFSYENQRLSNLSEEIKNQKDSLLKPVRYQKVSFKQTFTNPILKGSKTVTSSLLFKNNKTAIALASLRKALQKPTSLESKGVQSLQKNLQKWNFLKNANIKEPSTKINPNNPNKGYFNLSLSYQTYMVSYPPISKFDSLLDPSLNQNLNLILNSYLNKTFFGTCSSFNIVNGNVSLVKKDLKNATLTSPSVKGTTVANSFYCNINNLIQNVFESPCFSYNLTYPIDKFTLYKKAKISGPDGKMQNTQFFYSFPNNSLSGGREEIQSNKPFAQTNYASPFIGEVVYTNKNLLNFSSITKGFQKENLGSLFKTKGPQKTLGFFELKKNRALFESPFTPATRTFGADASVAPAPSAKAQAQKQKPLFIKKSLTAVSFEENTLDSSSTEKAIVPPLSYSCMFLTQKDLISFYLPSNNFKQSLNINYGTNYQINDILVKFLNMAENTDSETIIKQLESFVRITSPFGEDKTVVNTFTKMLSKRKDNFAIKIDKLEAGLPLFAASSFSKTKSINKEIKNQDHKKLNMSLLGDFIMYGDPINNNKSAFDKGEDLREASGESLAAICANGQIIHYNNKKITLRRGQPIFISPKSILHKNDGEFIDPKTPVITLSYQKLKTGDIIQGIPKVEQFLEARTTKRGRLFRDSLPSLLKALFNRYQSKLPLELAVRQSFYKIQQIIVDGVQRVYKSQGVTIADKHLEVIVKQMTSKVRIIDGAQTGFFPGEIVDLNFVEKINKFLIKKITYEPLVLGITRASLEVDSFLSASSFQQTTRILSEAAIYKKKDFLKGLKENVILGNLIPAGTGYLVNQDDIYSQI